jgi:two-component system chemotaxis sensor kinase CheA
MEGTLAARLTAEHLQQDLRFLRTEVREFQKHWNAAVKDMELSQQGSTAGSSRTGRIESFRDRLRNIDRHVSTLTRKAQGHSKSLGRMVDSLLRDGKRVAMQPFSALTGSFPLMVREIARNEGKEVRFDVEGDSVEMDKRLLDELKSPLTHLLRNCIDHGIEKPELRLRRGKPSHGTVRILVNQVDGGKVRVDVSDDGTGIQHRKVAAAAAARGLISADQAQTMQAEAALPLIFHSGLSTAPIVTDLSGHGLGLAIVRQKVEELGGHVGVRSTEGDGTVFSLHLPMTLATFRGLVAEVEGRVFVLPTAHVARVIRVAQDKVSTVEGQETVRVEGRVVPLVRLEDALELPRKSLPGVRQNYLQAVVTRSGQDEVAFAVDRIGAEQEVLVKGLGPQLARVRNVAGATVLGSGEVVPILNVPDLVLTARTRSLGRRADAAQVSDTRKKRVLVAEDSITSRLLLKSILESAGYDVTTAVDGAEALALLKAEEFDVLVSDIEMPRMDGLQLTSRVRAEAHLEHLPVILVTALESRADRERGIDAGANAYIVKSSFDQGNLLDTVRRFL